MDWGSQFEGRLRTRLSKLGELWATPCGRWCRMNVGTRQGMVIARNYWLIAIDASCGSSHHCSYLRSSTYGSLAFTAQYQWTIYTFCPNLSIFSSTSEFVTQELQFPNKWISRQWVKFGYQPYFASKRKWYFYNSDFFAINISPQMTQN